MKRTLPVILFSALLLFPVFSERMPANMLGQIISGETEYFIETEGNTKTLYHDDVPVRTWTEDVSGNDRTVMETDLETQTSIVSTYSNSVLVSRDTVNADGSSVKTTYLYTEGSLLCTTVTDEEDNSSVEYYLRNPSDGSLIAVRRFENTELVGQSYLYAAESLYRNPGSSVITEGVFSVTEDGNITYERNGVSYTYRRDGKILLEKEGNITTEYLYDNDDLISITVSSDEPPYEKTVTEYEEGNAVLITKFRNNQMVELSDYSGENGAMVKTVYSSGAPVARIYYMEDNKRVQRVEYY